MRLVDLVVEIGSGEHKEFLLERKIVHCNGEDVLWGLLAEEAAGVKLLSRLSLEEGVLSVPEQFVVYPLWPGCCRLFCWFDGALKCELWKI